MMKNQTMYVFGENVIDMEAFLDPNNSRGIFVTTEYFSLPNRIGIRLCDGSNKYYGKIATNNKNITAGDSNRINLPVDRKYDLEGTLALLADKEVPAWKVKNNIDDFIDVILREKTGGGGAHNTAYGIQIYLNGHLTLHLDVELVVPSGSKMLKSRLPPGLKYHPLIDYADDKVPLNINVALEYGKKLTFRSKPAHSFNLNNKKLHIGNGDIVIIDSIKNKEYLEYIDSILDNGSSLGLYLAATDSMITSLGNKKVYDLALRSDLYVSNIEEFSLLCEKDISNDILLANRIVQFQEDMQKKYDKKGTIAITFGEWGSVIADKSSNIYFQPVASSKMLSPFKEHVHIVNTNGCGDTYFAVMAICEAIGYLAHISLNYANAAGHLCAFNDAATGSWMPTPSKIENYRGQFGNTPILKYDFSEKKFLKTGL